MVHCIRLRADASRATVDAEELTEDHDELQTTLQERESDVTLQELRQLAEQFAADVIMVDAVKLQLKDFTDRCIKMQI